MKYEDNSSQLIIHFSKLNLSNSSKDLEGCIVSQKYIRLFFIPKKSP